MNYKVGFFILLGGILSFPTQLLFLDHQFRQESGGYSNIYVPSQMVATLNVEVPDENINIHLTTRDLIHEDVTADIQLNHQFAVQAKFDQWTRAAKVLLVILCLSLVAGLVIKPQKHRHQMPETEKKTIHDHMRAAKAGRNACILFILIELFIILFNGGMTVHTIGQYTSVYFYLILILFSAAAYHKFLTYAPLFAYSGTAGLMFLSFASTQPIYIAFPGILLIIVFIRGDIAIRQIHRLIKNQQSQSI